MKKSFILYSELDVRDSPVDCVYFDTGECRAQPYLPRYKGYYKPTDPEQKEYCKDLDNFRSCPRLQAYQNDLKARGLEKEEEKDTTSSG